MHVYDVATGKALGDVMSARQRRHRGREPRVERDGTGFFYTRYPREGERPTADLDFYQRVYFHKLGTPASHRQVRPRQGLPAIAEIELETSDDGHVTSAVSPNGDGGEFAFYVRGAGRQVERRSHTFERQVVKTKFGHDGKLYVISDGAPARTSPASSPSTAPFANPDRRTRERRRHRDIVVDEEPPLRRRSSADRRSTRLPAVAARATAPATSADPQAACRCSRSRASRLQAARPATTSCFATRAPRTPGWYRYDAEDRARRSRPRYCERAPADMGDVRSDRETCTSKDGTKVPHQHPAPQGTQARRHQRRSAQRLRRLRHQCLTALPGGESLWLDQGGVFADANLRGGGEFGEEWHHAGNSTQQAERVRRPLGVRQAAGRPHATRPSASRIWAARTAGSSWARRSCSTPSVPRVVSRVGIYDMLRVELTPNGAFNVTEFGTVKDEEQSARSTRTRRSTT